VDGEAVGEGLGGEEEMYEAIGKFSPGLVFI
jgi:hypothetical protein